MYKNTETEKGLRWYKFENSLQGNTKDKGKLSK